jgi:hypothetical protein
MFQFLMDNSIFIIFIVCAAIIGRFEYKKYLQGKNINSSEFRSLFRFNINDVREELLDKLAASIVMTVVISLILSRQLWMNDTFHIVFLTNLLSESIWKYLNKVFN